MATMPSNDDEHQIMSRYRAMNVVASSLRPKAIGMSGNPCVIVWRQNAVASETCARGGMGKSCNRQLIIQNTCSGLSDMPCARLPVRALLAFCPFQIHDCTSDIMRAVPLPSSYVLCNNDAAELDDRPGIDDCRIRSGNLQLCAK